MRTTFEHSGEVGRDMLDVDWAATAVGPPEQWPDSLRAVVRLVLASRFAMWMAWGPDLTFFCNDAYRRDTLGEKYPWALGRPAREVWSEIWHDIAPRIDSVLTTGEATWDEQLMLFLQRSGFTEETYHTFSYSPLADDDGAVSGMLCVVSEDTEAVVASRRMRTLRDLGARTTVDLSEAETIASACTALGGNGQDLPFVLCYLFDPDGTSARLAGSAGFTGPHPAAPARLHRADPDRVWPLPDGDGGVVTVEDLHERFGDLPSGAWEQEPALGAVVPLPSTTPGAPYGFLVVGVNPFRPWDQGYADFLELVAGQIAADVTDARAFELEKVRAEGLAELDRAKTEFFTNISHEFRTPLTLLLGPTEDALADASAPLPEVQAHRLEVVHRNAQRLLKLVNTLLDFSRLEAGRADLSYAPVDLAAHTRELVGMFESAAARLDLALVVDCPPLPEPVHVDLDAWSKVVLNLLSNALKFTLHGEVRIALRAEDGYAVLRVSDTGAGIPAAEQPRLFERFQRASSARSRTHEGSGIGLALVAELVQSHGGDVGVTSAPGEGSTFTVRLPFGSAHLDPARLAAEADRGPTAQVVAGFLDEAQALGVPAASTAPALVGGRPRVLVVDDNPDVRDYVSELLAEQYDVTTAVDGEDGLDRARADVPDLVLTDVMMPRLDGFGLLQALRDDEVTQDVPVVMLSARAGEDGTLEGLEAGADDYLAKPFTARELMARVRSNLELDRARRAREQLERSRALLDQAQRLASVGSWEVDLPTGRVRATDEFLRIVGIDRDQLDGLRYPALVEELVHPDDRATVLHALEAADDPDDIRYEARIVRPDGAEVTATVHAEVVRHPGGEPGLLRGSLQDVTERVEAERMLAEATAAREAATREHLIAEELQQSLLPTRVFDLEDLEVATYYRAGVEGTQVGGDWYDVIELGGGRTALVIGDVMGRGVRAAAVMGQLRAATRAYARLDLAPADLLEHLDGLVRWLGGDQIVTCVYAIFDPADQVLRLANAGHLPAVLVAPDGTTSLAPLAQDPPLGAGAGRLTQVELTVPLGSTVVLYTDGLVERRGEDLEEGIAALRDLCGTLDVPLELLPEELVRLRLPDGPDDDVAVLAARVAETGVQAVRELVLEDADTAPTQARDAVRRHLEDVGVTTREVVEDALLVTSELVTNAVLHAEAPVELRLVSSRTELRIEVHDREASQPLRRSPDLDDEHGRGLTIVAALSTHWGTRPSGSGKVVWAVLDADRG
ncbi:SpoIIE family protein phosphatase [Nocardioides anomalus]|uniref:histidine kinase n=1 Tax=Nocardioides anomalus TaxID=2712223 RepID=A0A6G6WI07_9ACTN|nr:SpoIIE family protein phosphatase [Nocardioides anomalus]QIG44971.1 SpoIIE family protein phosphatase [Nocardioides anomalus]